MTGLAAGLSNNIIIADGDGNQRINVDAIGNVGIGTSMPSAKLTVSGALLTTLDSVINGITIGLGSGSIVTNTAIGSGALYSNVSGIENTAL